MLNSEELTPEEEQIIALHMQIAQLLARCRNVLTYAENKSQTRHEPWQEIVINELKNIVEKLEKNY